MSLSSALNSALSGLTAASKGSAVVSENIANVMTPGYARRSLELASAVETGPGVRIMGVHRHADPGIISDRRGADAEFGNAKVLADFSARFEALVGRATDPASISMQLAQFENSLISAASYPDSAQRLDGVAHAGNELAGAINTAAEGLRQIRTQADRSIDLQVDRLNRDLSDVQKLNVRITSTSISGGDTSALLDQRQMLVDEINEVVPVKQVEREYGQIALYTDGGAILLDGSAAIISFSAVMDTVPEMTIENGGLSGLEINGVPITERAISGGKLAAEFHVRDELAVSAQAELDAVARDLIERFEAPALDATTSPGDPGLFTDNGLAFDPLLAIGLSGRLQFNPIADPEEGGESWRLRAGLGASDPGMTGESRLLRAFSDVLNEARPSVSPIFGTGLVTAAGVSSSLLSHAALKNSVAERALSFASVSQVEFTRIELAQGVDTDAELKSLMIIEQSYAANARMMEAIDEMMKTILRL